MDNDNQLVVFGVEDQDYAFPIQKIREIIHIVTVTLLSSISAYMKVIINLQGIVFVPVVELRLKLGLPVAELGNEAKIIDFSEIKYYGKTHAGFRVGFTVDAGNISVPYI